jgi:hypothetical protein
LNNSELQFNDGIRFDDLVLLRFTKIELKTAEKLYNVGTSPATRKASPSKVVSDESHAAALLGGGGGKATKTFFTDKSIEEFKPLQPPVSVTGEKHPDIATSIEPTAPPRPSAEPTSVKEDEVKRSPSIRSISVKMLLSAQSSTAGSQLHLPVMQEDEENEDQGDNADLKLNDPFGDDFLPPTNNEDDPEFRETVAHLDKNTYDKPMPLLPQSLSTSSFLQSHVLTRYTSENTYTSAE